MSDDSEERGLSASLVRRSSTVQRIEAVGASRRISGQISTRQDRCARPCLILDPRMGYLPSVASWCCSILFVCPVPATFVSMSAFACRLNRLTLWQSCARSIHTVSRSRISASTRLADLLIDRSDMRDPSIAARMTRGPWQRSLRIVMPPALCSNASSTSEMTSENCGRLRSP